MSGRIDLLILEGSQYHVLEHFTSKLGEAFNRLGIETRLLTVPEGERVPVDFQDLPLLTLSFNGRPEHTLQLCDATGVPHLCITVDPPTRFNWLVDNPYIVTGCDDRSGPRLFKMMGLKRSFFLPHAVEADLTFDPEAERPYDVTLLATYIDYRQIEQEVHRCFPEEVATAFDEAAAGAFTNRSDSFIELFLDGIVSKIPDLDRPSLLANRNIIVLCWWLEAYIKGRERALLVKGITDAEVHIFGNNAADKGWQDEVAGQENVVVHNSVSFLEAYEVMKRSKIILNSSIKNKEGAHERIFSGPLSGSLVAAMKNPFLAETFDEASILFYDYSSLESLNDRINAFLDDETRRKKVVHAGREKVLEAHTWDHRAREILEKVPTFFKSLSELAS